MDLDYVGSLQTARKELLAILCFGMQNAFNMPSSHVSLSCLPSLYLPVFYYCSILEVELDAPSLFRPCDDGGFGWKKWFAICRGWARVDAKHDVLKVQGSQR